MVYSRKRRITNCAQRTIIERKKPCRSASGTVLFAAHLYGDTAAVAKRSNTVQELWRKAEDRNPDEFYFAMEHRRTKAGVDVGR